MADEVKLLVAAAESFLGAFHDHRGRCAHCDIDADALRAAIEAWNTRSPSTLPDGWRERVKTALREHHRRVYNEYGAFWFDGELDQMADAIGEVFGEASKPTEPNPSSPGERNG